MSPDLLTTHPRLADALYVLATHGDGEGTSLHVGWSAICDAVVTCHYYKATLEQRREVMDHFWDLENWTVVNGDPWHWQADYEDGHVVVYRITAGGIR